MLRERPWQASWRLSARACLSAGVGAALGQGYAASAITGVRYLLLQV